MWQSWMRWKMTLWKWHTFFNGPMFNLLFYCHITERKWLLIRNLAIILPSNPNCLENFNVLILLMKVSKYWKIVAFQKISIKMKNCKTFYETQTASCLKEIIQPPQPLIRLDKIFSLWNKNFLERYTEIYRYLLSRK